MQLGSAHLETLESRCQSKRARGHEGKDQGSEAGLCSARCRRAVAQGSRHGAPSVGSRVGAESGARGHRPGVGGARDEGVGGPGRRQGAPPIAGLWNAEVGTRRRPVLLCLERK